MNGTFTSYAAVRAVPEWLKFALASIAEELENTSRDSESAEAIKRAIAAVTDHDKPKDSDVARVRARLAAGGWPLAKPEHFGPAHWP
jgi:Protein of unknown function (DUF3349)